MNRMNRRQQKVLYMKWLRRTQHNEITIHLSLLLARHAMRHHTVWRNFIYCLNTMNLACSPHTNITHDIIEFSYSESVKHHKLRQHSWILYSVGKVYFDLWYLLSSSNCDRDNGHGYMDYVTVHTCSVHGLGSFLPSFKISLSAIYLLCIFMCITYYVTVHSRYRVNVFSLLPSPTPSLPLWPHTPCEPLSAILRSCRVHFLIFYCYHHWRRWGPS